MQKEALRGGLPTLEKQASLLECGVESKDANVFHGNVSHWDFDVLPKAKVESSPVRDCSLGRESSGLCPQTLTSITIT